MDIINRYIYAVTKKLPEKQRQDIEAEIKTLIDDMVDNMYSSESYNKKVEKALLDLGDPEVLANNYSNSKRYLIGPKNYDNYLAILKIVTGAIFIGVSIAVLLGNIFSSQQDIFQILGDYAASLFSAIIQGAAWVTLAFAVAERNESEVLSVEKKKEWDLSKLPEIPKKEAAISRVESIVSIVFSIVLISIIYFAPQLFGVFVSNNASSTIIIPVFNIDTLNTFKLVFAGIFIANIFKETIKMISGRWTFKTSILISIFSLISTVLMLTVFLNQDIWNVNFAAELNKHTNLSFDLSNMLGNNNAWIIVIIIAICILDVSNALYRGIKYNGIK